MTLRQWRCFNASNSLVSMETTVFRNNSLGNISPNWPVPPSILIFTASDANVTACFFADNSAYSLLTGQGSGRNHYTYMKRTTFMSNRAVLLHLHSVKDVILENSIFGENFRTSTAVGINITNSETVRLEASAFSSPMYFHQYGVFPQTVQIYSLRSNFTNGSSFIETDSPYFLEKAKAMGLLRTDPRIIAQQTESPYTSREYMYLQVYPVVDLGVQTLSISCSFWGNLTKSYVVASLEGWRPHFREILYPPLIPTIFWPFPFIL